MTTQAATPPPLMRCTAPEHRQFDFWIGEWDVVGGPQRDRLVGSNRIERSGIGRWLAEHWRGASGKHGTSTNAWGRAAPGLAAVLGRRRRRGVATRRRSARQGHGDERRVTEERRWPQRQRIRWTPEDDGSVIQQWDISDDDGANWSTSFRGVYRRKAVSPK